MTSLGCCYRHPHKKTLILKELVKLVKLQQQLVPMNGLKNARLYFDIDSDNNIAFCERGMKTKLMCSKHHIG